MDSAKYAILFIKHVIYTGKSERGYMSKIKALFVDIDGTLISEKQSRVTPAEEQAFVRLREQGIKVCIATGRHMQEICYGDLTGNIVFDGFVTLNGQYCLAVGPDGQSQVVYQNCIDQADIRRLVEYLKQTHTSCVFLEDRQMYVNLLDERLIAESKRIGVPIPEQQPLENALKGRIIQVIPFVEEEREAEILKLMPHCEQTRWSDLAIDIVPKGGSKAVGISRMLTWFSLEPKEIMAIGDGHNDMEMLQYAGIGVAMGNASEAVKACADYVTGDVNAGGLVMALRHFGLV